MDFLLSVLAGVIGNVVTRLIEIVATRGGRNDLDFLYVARNQRSRHGAFGFHSLSMIATVAADRIQWVLMRLGAIDAVSMINGAMARAQSAMLFFLFVAPVAPAAGRGTALMIDLLAMRFAGQHIPPDVLSSIGIGTNLALLWCGCIVAAKLLENEHDTMLTARGVLVGGLCVEGGFCLHAAMASGGFLNFLIIEGLALTVAMLRGRLIDSTRARRAPRSWLPGGRPLLGRGVFGELRSIDAHQLRRRGRPRLQPGE